MRAIRVAVVAAVCVLLAAPAAAADEPAQPAPADAAATLLRLLNQQRATAGEAPFTARVDVASIAGRWSDRLAADQALSHDEAYFSDADRRALNGWALGENVAASPSIEQAHEALMASPPHRHNILDARFTVVGIGTTYDGSRWWITEDFVQPLPPPPPPGPAAAPAPTTSTTAARRTTSTTPSTTWPRAAARPVTTTTTAPVATTTSATAPAAAAVTPPRQLSATSTKTLVRPLAVGGITGTGFGCAGMRRRRRPRR